MTLVEIVIALVVLGLCLIPTIGLFNLGYESATLSEDRIYAETLASRVIEVWNGRTYEKLLEMVGKPDNTVVEAVFGTDKNQDWFERLPEYARNLSVGRDFFQGTLEVVEVDKGLLSLEVSIRWTVLEGGMKGETRQFKLLAFRSREDLSVDSLEGDTLE